MGDLVQGVDYWRLLHEGGGGVELIFVESGNFGMALEGGDIRFVREVGGICLEAGEGVGVGYVERGEGVEMGREINVRVEDGNVSVCYISGSRNEGHEQKD